MAKQQTQKQKSTKAILTEVAARAEVSFGTVSRVFNDSTLIPENTRIKVVSAARELKFRPRVGVRQPKIALITEPPARTVMGGYVCSLTQYIGYALSRSGAGMVMVTEDRLEKLAASWFDGIIGITWQPKTLALLKEIKNIPIVWFSDQYGDLFHTVCADCRKTGRIAGDYLTGKGHRRIAVIHDDDYTGRERVAGVKESMTAKKIDISRNLFCFPNNMPLHLAVKQICDAECTAVWVTGEDMKVLEVNWLLQELAGKRIPEDISLMGFENPGISEFCRPSLTTVASPLCGMAEQAVELVLSKKTEAPVHIELPVKLMERASVASIAGKDGKP